MQYVGYGVYRISGFEVIRKKLMRSKNNTTGTTICSMLDMEYF